MSKKITTPEHGQIEVQSTLKHLTAKLHLGHEVQAGSSLKYQVPLYSSLFLSNSKYIVLGINTGTEEPKKLNCDFAT